VTQVPDERGALRRGYRGLDRVPVIGPSVKAAADFALKPAFIWAEAKSSRTRNRHGRGVYAAVWRNSRSGFERLYRTQDLLDEYLSEERIAFYDSVAAVCAGLEPRSVIDVGCGAGNLIEALRRSCSPEVQLVGVDFAASGIERLAELVPDAEGIVADVYSLDLGDRVFDLVVSTEVLEHLKQPLAAVRVLDRLRSPNGAIVITVPDGAFDDYEGHVNFWRDSELTAFLAPFGAVDVRRVGPSDDLLAIVH